MEKKVKLTAAMKRRARKSVRMKKKIDSLTRKANRLLAQAAKLRKKL